eukprot:CAMPEP_0174831944 /NCGR_PEP_ID=MMETSP1114-20130205/3397_1 /TAXON_ID=312471 /ORGANISM="Neobodo designis, Strain CCAP 1951/1" /LENGTH=329 /DNA_ID=CAMNT_0016065791 /DNA_START=32 /DNA_END=1017 /DNA_ORIENTATION=-
MTSPVHVAVVVAAIAVSAVCRAQDDTPGDLAHAHFLHEVPPPPVPLIASEAGFEEWQRKHRRAYDDGAAASAAYAAYADNVGAAARMQRVNPHATFAVGRRADVRFERALPWPKRHRPPAVTEPPRDLPRPTPPHVDWRAVGAVVPVADVGACAGAAVAFTVTTVASAAAKLRGISGKELVAASAQQLVDCGRRECHGTTPDAVVQSLLANNGGLLLTNKSYPWRRTSQACDSKRIGGVAAYRVTGTRRFNPDDEADLEYQVSQGPVGVTVRAADWGLYEGGVISECGRGSPGGKADYVATIVGYNNAANPPHWILQHSWGAEWGIGGA